jgi:hypothetical protein
MKIQLWYWRTSANQGMALVGSLMVMGAVLAFLVAYGP